jgi:peptidoglycan lytic transglycosylase
MRRRIVYGLAVFLSVTGLGAAHGPNNAEASKTQQRTTRTSTTTKPAKSVNRKPAAKPYQVGTASWYGKDFQGKPTASGEPYDMFDLTCAHMTLPLGTYVRVTNLRNGRAVVVRVNDRGPVVPGRIIDLSYGAARALEMKAYGVQQVRVDLVLPRTVAEAQPVAQLP